MSGKVRNGNHVLRRLRKGLGLSQRVMAEETGLSAVYLSQVETGAFDMGRDAGLAIVERYRREMAELRITLEDLLRSEETAAEPTSGAAA